MLLIDTKSGWEPQNLPVPTFRSLLKVTGDLQQLSFKLEQLEERQHLESLIEVELQEEQYDAAKIYALDELVSNFKKEGFKIVKHRANFKNQLKGAAQVFASQQQLQDLQPKDVFLELIKRHDYDEATRSEILSAFEELLEEVQRDESVPL